MKKLGRLYTVPNKEEAHESLLWSVMRLMSLFRPTHDAHKAKCRKLREDEKKRMGEDKAARQALPGLLWGEKEHYEGTIGLPGFFRM